MSKVIKIIVGCSVFAQNFRNPFQCSGVLLFFQFLYLSPYHQIDTLCPARKMYHWKFLLIFVCGPIRYAVFFTDVQSVHIAEMTIICYLLPKEIR